MIKYRYEFEAPLLFVKGYCPECPLSYVDTDGYGDDMDICVLGYDYEECPLQKVSEEECINIQ